MIKYYFLFFTIFALANSLFSNEAVFSATQYTTDSTNTHIINQSIDQTTLFGAIKRNDKNAVTDLLKKGHDPNIRDDQYRTPLMYVDNKSKDIAEILLSHGAYLNTRDSAGNTALMIASEKGYSELIRLLLQYSILVNTENRSGITALHLAVQNGHTDVVKALIDHGANIQHPYPTGFPPIVEAVKNGFTGIVDLFLKRGINPNTIIPTTGTSLLSIASAYGYRSTVQLLLKNKANPNLENKLGVTPIFLSVSQKHSTVTQLLVDHGATISIVTKNGVNLKDIVHPDDLVTKKILGLIK